MSKIYLIGDTHISLGYPNKYSNWKKVHLEYFEEFLLPFLKKEVQQDDLIIHLGDYFDNRSVIPIDMLNYGFDIAEKISKIAPFHIIVGNHDCWHKSTSDINSIRPFRYIPNVSIHDKTSTLEFMGKKLLFMPYLDTKEEQIKILKSNKDCHFVFCHSDLNGAKMHLTSIAHKNNDKIDVEEFSNFKKVYSGHLHIQQSMKNFTFVGSVFEMDRNDMNNQKGIFILDVITEEETFIPNNISPKFKRVYIRTQEDIETIEDISTKDYVDLFISNSLLINNRKLRRKLEMILESGSFASVDYIDDLILESNDEKNKSIVDDVSEEELNSGIVPSLQLEYTDLIRQYINNQKYETEKIKSGVLQEFNEIAKIYDEGYKVD